MIIIISRSYNSASTCRNSSSIYWLHLVEIICASVVDIMQEAGSDHGHHFQICVIPLQFACLAPYKTKQKNMY